MQKCRTIELLDYRAVRLSIRTRRDRRVSTIDLPNAENPRADIAI